jgi:phage minor structural protein
VPEETIETAVSGLEADVYRTNTSAALRSGASEPTAVTYSEWSSANVYSVGDKVTCSGARHRNYECIQYDGASGQTQVPPYNNSAWWSPISDTSGGSPIIVTLATGTELYFLEDAGSGWYKMSTLYGMEGYVKSSQLTYDRHLTPAETQPRTITDQLFRIRTVSIETKARTVTATAEHVSYDLSGVLIDNAKITRKNPAYALAWLESCFMIPYRGMIATNMTTGDDGEYSCDIKGKSATYALLDPDSGVVSTLDAMYRRDNWDVFIMRKTETDRGFRLQYRKNMTGVSWNIKTDKMVTRVVPVAKAADGSDLYLDNDGARWVDSEDIGDWPVIRMERLTVNGQVGKDDGTETGTKWTEESLREEMEAKAEERFTKDKADVPVHEITVDFHLLGDTAEYAALKGLEKVLMYDTVTVINEEIGLSASVTVTEIEYDCIRKRITALKMSNVNAYNGRNVSGYNVMNNSIGKSKLMDEVAADIIDQVMSLV